MLIIFFPRGIPYSKKFFKSS
ncbi:hypothetical protein CP8484711_1292A, partial [Chlamydia psittaci 84-8471/1]